MNVSRSTPRRLGIYGGTFAPPHVAHVRVARQFLDEAALDSLLVIPTAIPPHKRIDTGDDPMLRLMMAHAAFDGMDARICVSDYEVQKAGVSYTYETLSHFAAPGRQLFFLCGTDMFLTLDNWRNPATIFSLAVIACVMRENSPDAYAAVRRKNEEYERRFGARTLFLANTPVSLSSTEVRRIVCEGGDISALVPPKVAQIIEEYGLYKTEEQHE